MTSRNPAVDAMLADLRHDLLTPPGESVAAEHLAVLRLEHQLFTSDPQAPARSTARSIVTPSLAHRARARIRRETSTRSRRVIALIATLSVVTGTVSLNAAGALPGTIRHIGDHITNSIVHTFDTPQPPHSHASGRTGSGTAATAAAKRGSHAQSIALGPTRTGSYATSSNGAQYGPPSPATGSQGTSTSEPGVTQQGTSGTPDPSGSTPGTIPPPKQTMQKDPGTPPGFPADWRVSAIDAARAQLAVCARAASLTPVGCPQQAFSSTAPTSVHWKILNEPLAGAAALAQVATNASPGQPATYQVFVYGLFQMDASYTVSIDPSNPRDAYSGGIAQATMNWNGSGFESVSFVTGPYSQQVPSGASVPPFLRPPSFTDNDVLIAVADGFNACAAAVSTPDASVANCPQVAPENATVTSGVWSLVGDPIPGSSVTFDPAHGDFIVRGGYAMSLTEADGTVVPVTGQYTATLCLDGTQLRLISIDPL